MKKLNPLQTASPIEKGRIRVTIRYRSGESNTYEGIFNPDRNLAPLTRLLRKRAPKPQLEESVAGASHVA